MSEATTTRAAMIVIGNEILSGKITDSNSGFLARELRRMGVSLERIVVIPDVVAVIAATVRGTKSGITRRRKDPCRGGSIISIIT